MSGFGDNKPFLGLYEKALPENLDWEERLSLAHQAGYNFMELSIDVSDERLERLNWDKIKRRKLKELAEDIEIPLLTMCLSANRKFPIGSAYQELRNKGMKIMEDAIWLAFNMGIRIIQVAGYDVLMDEASTDKTIETYLNNMKKSVGLASKLGVVLAIENVDIYSANSVEKIMYYVNKIKSPWLQIYPDIGNLSAMKLDILKELKLGESHLAAIHIKDSIENVFRRIPYGEGDVDFISAFKTLKKINFHGPLLLEMWADYGKDNFSIIMHAKDWISDKINQAEYS
ncbi:MAG: L-ribulose-5-phosphate 3-epimerase [Actinobacteria bacterium]|nr:L-ribulose-5-phosphate 3-epimerase [Actinomycetota bacterium]